MTRGARFSLPFSLARQLQESQRSPRWRLCVLSVPITVHHPRAHYSARVEVCHVWVWRDPYFLVLVCSDFGVPKESRPAFFYFSISQRAVASRSFLDSIFGTNFLNLNPLNACQYGLTWSGGHVRHGNILGNKRKVFFVTSEDSALMRKSIVRGGLLA